MPQTKFQKIMFALITVLITVPCFVFYCSSYEAGGFTVDVIKSSWIFIPIEFVLAFLCEIFIGSPLSLKIAFKAVNPKETHPFIVETIIISATAMVMCPLMSFLATIMYNGIIEVGIFGGDFNHFIVNFIPFWFQKVVLNFPFALLSQLCLIQPLTRMIFRKIFKNNSYPENTQNSKEFAEQK